MKKVLAIMGSPRKGKNTNSALDFFLEGLDQGQFSLDKVYLMDLSIGHCTGCDYCGSTGICIIKDDMQSLYDKIDQSDLVILAAPLYFNSINGLSKNMIDRCQKYWSQKYSLGQSYKRGEDRLGVFIGGARVAGNQRTHHNQAEKNCKKPFHVTSSIISFWLRRVINSMHQKHKKHNKHTKKIERRYSSAPFYLSYEIISR